VSAMLVAAVGQVPGAVGVLEATMVPAFREALPVAAVLAALMAFRVLFYLLPLGLAVGAFAAWTIRGARASGRATAYAAPPSPRPPRPPRRSCARAAVPAAAPTAARGSTRAGVSAQQGIPGIAWRHGVHVRFGAARVPHVRPVWPQLDLPGRPGRTIRARPGADHALHPRRPGQRRPAGLS